MVSPVVLNAGIGGNNTRNLLDRLEADVLAKSPTLVCVLVGANDFLNSGNAVSFEEYQANVKTIADRIRASGSALLWMTILPCYEPYLLSRHDPDYFADLAPNDRVRQANAFLQEFCAQASIPLVELYTPFATIGEPGPEPHSLYRNAANSENEDGVHPTADGYRLIAALVGEAIVRLGLPTERVVCFGDSITYGCHVPGEGTAEGHTYPGRLAILLAGQE